MNNINFTGRNNFPLSVETMTFLQDMIGTSATLALLGGDTYILSGCETTDLTVSNGYLVINGEILKFTGGALQEYVYIKEAKRTVIAQGYTFPEVYNTRTVEFGYGDTRYKWENFKRISTNTQLADAIANINTTIESLQGTPKGIISMWSGSVDNIPEGWALCAGQESWIPNLSGRFVVGFDKNDDDYNQIGKTGGAKETIITTQQMPKHRHVYTDDVYANGAFTSVESGFPNAYDEKTSSISGEKKGQGRAYYTTYSGESQPIDRRPLTTF